MAYDDCAKAPHALLVAQTHALPTTLEDTMLAYLVAKDWCKRIEDSSSSIHSPLFNHLTNYASMLPMFEVYAVRFEDELELHEYLVKEMFKNLNSDVLKEWCSPETAPRNEAELLCKSLRVTADFFAKKCNEPAFNELLNKKQIPQLSYFE